jgi:L-ribulokinase
MSEKKFVIGIEFGLRTDRAVLVNLRDRSEIIAVVSDFPNGAIDHTLPDSGKQIPTE